MADSKKRSPLLWTAALGLLALAAAWVSMAAGSRQGRITFKAGWAGDLFQGSDPLQRQILLSLRAPRVAAGLLVGVALAVAGLLLQGVTRNPLADPYLLGISGGAGLAVVLLHAFHSVIDTIGWWLIPAAAFAGAQASALLVLRLARGAGERFTILGLILSGVVINAFCAAMMSFLLARFDPFKLRITTLWLAGGIGFTHPAQLGLALVVVAAGWIYLRTQAHRLNAMALGAEGAGTVGVDAERLLLRAASVASLLTGVGVSLGGLLGYVGLIVPHAVRLLMGQDFRVTLPVAASAGALLLVLADLAARLAFAPEELPVGVLTAILGCPLLLVLLRAQLRR